MEETLNTNIKELQESIDSGNKSEKKLNTLRERFLQLDGQREMEVKGNHTVQKALINKVITNCRKILKMQ